MSEQDWAHKICEEIFLENQMKTGLPSSYTLQKAVIKALREARKIEWPSSSEISSASGLGMETKPTFEQIWSFCEGALWLKSYIESRRV